MNTSIRKTWLPLTVSVALGASLAGCGGSYHTEPAAASQVPQLPLDSRLVAAGQQTFRFDTFGDETFWTDTLKMNAVIESAVDPLTAASVGLKIDAAALPATVVTGVIDGTIPLNDPQTTLALLSLNAVVGVKGQVSKGADGKLHLDRVGITCALCHSTVSRDLQITAPGAAGAKINLAGIVGNRLDGWPNRDLQPGTIISLSPALTAGQKAEYASWATLFGPGFYDPRINVQTDPGSNPAVNSDIDANIMAYKAAGGIPVVIPAALGLVGLSKAIFTGDGDTAHEPAGPVSYWNRYVRGGPKNLDSLLSVISARRGDGIARWQGDENGKAVEKESRGGVQGEGGFGGDPRRQDDGGAGHAVRCARASNHRMEEAAA